MSAPIFIDHVIGTEAHSTGMGSWNGQFTELSSFNLSRYNININSCYENKNKYLLYSTSVLGPFFRKFPRTLVSTIMSLEQETNRQIVLQSLAWRLKKLEDRLVAAKLPSQNQSNQQSLIDRLSEIAKNYKTFLSLNPDFDKFATLHAKHKSALEDFSSHSDQSTDTKIDIILSYEEELIDYMNNSKKMAELANQVLDQNKWPDMTKYKEQLDKIATVTVDQQRQLNAIDSTTRDYLELYNETIETIKRKIVIWDEKIRSLEEMDKDEDKDKDVE